MKHCLKTLLGADESIAGITLDSFNDLFEELRSTSLSPEIIEKIELNLLRAITEVKEDRNSNEKLRNAIFAFWQIIASTKGIEFPFKEYLEKYLIETFDIESNSIYD